MGNTRWNPADWMKHSAQANTQTRAQIFRQAQIHPDLDPLNIKVRESRDSAANPLSTPIAIACDHTGSMGELAEIIIKKGLGTIMEEIYDRKPVTDPHVMIMATGDAFSDQAPIQATQFEASIVLADQLKNIFIEGNGGGNGGESYNLAWYFMLMKTSCDSQIKRKKKGYIFTIGDEPPHKGLPKERIKQFFGDDSEQDFTSDQLLARLLPNWEVFHLIVRPGSYPDAITRWQALLNERAILVSDHEKLAEVIVSTIEVIEGKDADQVAASWSGDTSVVVRDAVKGLTKRSADTPALVRL